MTARSHPPRELPTLGEVAREVFAGTCLPGDGHVDTDGDGQVGVWHELTDNARAAWENVAAAVREAVILRAAVAGMAARRAGCCSFCGKPARDAQVLVAGPNDVSICRACVELAAVIALPERAL